MDNKEKTLREFAKSKDLVAYYYKKSGLWGIKDIQTGKMVAMNLTLGEAFSFINAYPW